LIADEECRARSGVASLTRDDAQLNDVADRREHVTSGHVVRQVLVAGGGGGTEAGVDRVGSLPDDSVATCGATARGL